MTYQTELELQVEKLTQKLQEVQEDKDHYKNKIREYEENMFYCLGRLFITSQESETMSDFETIFIDFIMERSKQNMPPISS
jgi:chromosome segregation ATPase